jgi:hypothetical protein
MKILIPVMLAALSLCNSLVPQQASAQATAIPLRWQNLGSPQQLWPGKGAIYYTFSTERGARVHLIVVDLKSGKWQLKPAVGQATSPCSVTAEKENASAAINAGYFNLSDGASTSFVTVDGKECANPNANKGLVDNPKLKTFLPQIFNRSELRILQNSDGKAILDIVAHDAPLPAGTRLIHALQAGPQLLPVITAEKEAFVRTESDGQKVDSIGTTRGAARTAIGLTDDGYALLASVADARQDPESAGISLQELADLLKKLGCVKALNFDGGASTTMYVRMMPAPITPVVPAGQVVCGKTPETRVKSVLLLMPTQNADSIRSAATRFSNISSTSK